MVSKNRKTIISIIVCSRFSKIASTLSNNINSTIGDIDYEIIWIDNSLNQYSIFEAYNIGVEKSTGNYLCFMHEDIIFHSKNWGNIIKNIFNNEKVGIIGVIGGYYIGKFSTDWYSSRITRGEIIQGYYKKNLYQKKHFNVNKYNYGPYVAAIDGLWMCIPKNLFTNHKIQWDSNTFHGFHLYDLDICMQVNSLGYKIQIADDILIEHQSSGNPNKTFYDNCVLFHKKWNRILPFTSTLQINSEDIEKYELTILSNLCTFMHLYKEQQRILNQPLHKLVSKITSFVNKWRK